MRDRKPDKKNVGRTERTLFLQKMNVFVFPHISKTKKKPSKPKNGSEVHKKNAPGGKAPDVRSESNRNEDTSFGYTQPGESSQIAPPPLFCYFFRLPFFSFFTVLLTYDADS